MSSRAARFIIVAVYFIIGIVIAWDHGYMGLNWLRAVASAILAVFMWWLVLLGINVHIHR